MDNNNSCYFIRWLFLRSLGIIYLIAFLSLWVQIIGLIGSDGILPFKSFLNSVSQNLGNEKYWLLPTLCWFNTNDFFLHFLCAGGVFLSLLLIFDYFCVVVLLFLWAFYLSIVVVSGDFLSFQWDNLLLEAGFLAIFFAPLKLFPKSSDTSIQRIVLYLFYWLLFRLTFFSGVVKLTSGDPNWRNLTALNYHYETQPLPTWVGYYISQAPEWFHKTSCALTFFIELFVPFLIIAPRKFRIFAGIILIVFQLLIMVTGNYCFFNLLTIALCILLFDDELFPLSFRNKIVKSVSDHTLRIFVWWKRFVIFVSVTYLIVSTMQVFRITRVNFEWPTIFIKLYNVTVPFRTINNYGLFAVMTTSRPEIIIEGSNDKVNWQQYEFNWKPGNIKRVPAFVEPHQPRLDWQMWFAALSNYQNNPWFVSFCARLLEGSKDVVNLLKKNPFSKNPPRYIRAVLYDYHFTDLDEKKSTKSWWVRMDKGLYFPLVTLKDGTLVQVVELQGDDDNLKRQRVKSQ